MTPPPHSPRPVFRPRFTLLILYLIGFTTLFALLFALPDLLHAAREAAAGQGELSEAELRRGREITRQALRGRMPWIFGAAFVLTALGAYSRRLPGLPRD